MPKEVSEAIRLGRQWAEELDQAQAGKTLMLINRSGVLAAIRTEVFAEAGTNDITSFIYRDLMNRKLKQCGLHRHLPKYDQAALLYIADHFIEFMAWYTGKSEQWRRRHTRLRSLRKDFEAAQGDDPPPAAKPGRKKPAGQRAMTPDEMRQVMERREADLAERDAEIVKLTAENKKLSNNVLSKDVYRTAGVILSQLEDFSGKDFPKQLQALHAASGKRLTMMGLK
jgi:hypothetical protein